MIDKRVASPAEAVADIPDGATVMIGGFGEAGSPIELIHALIDIGQVAQAPGDDSPRHRGVPDLVERGRRLDQLGLVAPPHGVDEHIRGRGPKVLHR